MSISAWTLTVDEVAHELASSLSQGLSKSEAWQRFERFGPNVLASSTSRSALRLFFSQFANVMVGLLASAAVISALLGDVSDAVLIALILLINSTIGFLQEWKAEQAVGALQKMSSPWARVRREGKLESIPVSQVVPGDVIELKGGDIVPADARLISGDDFETDEASLTGESLPVEKSPDALPEETPLPDRSCMVYSGTPVMRGRGIAMATSTGMQTELGKIAAMLQGQTTEITPLQRRLAQLGRRLAAIVLAVSLGVFLIGMLRERRENWNRELFSRMFLVSVSLAVAAIPEGLPAVITVALTLGSQRMARRKAIVRRLSAVETLGSVNVILSDKTGTLTRNQMIVADTIPADEFPDSTQLLLEASVLCNDAEMSLEGNPIGSATESAFLQAAIERNVDVAALRSRFPRVAEVPFSSARKRMATLHREAATGEYRVFVKGAAERIVERCGRTTAGPITPDNRAGWLGMINELASRGNRVLACATRSWDGSSLAGREEEAEKELQLLGLICLTDPIRSEAAAAIDECHSAGMRVVMMTGDHAGTAHTVAESIGLFDGGARRVLSGAEVNRMSDDDLARHAAETAVFARVAPEHKLRIVKAWQSQQALTAVTGDGVNDAPALRQSDIGIAMGVTGSDVAKQAADLVLADDNFATIVAAVEEGRIVYDNIRKFLAYLLTTNAGEILTLVLALVIGLPVPLLPVQILWINLVSDGLPALALGFEWAESNLMSKPPRARDEGLLDRGLGIRILATGLLMAATCVLVFWAYAPSAANGTGSLDYARTMVFFILSLAQMFYVMGIRSTTDRFWRKENWTNWRLSAAVATGIALQFVITYLPRVRSYFHAVPLGARDVLIALGAAAIPLIAYELEKSIVRRRQGGGQIKAAKPKARQTL